MFDESIIDFGYFSLSVSFLIGCCHICPTLCKMQAFVPSCIMISRKKSSFFQVRGAVIAVVLIMHYDLKKKSSFFQAQGAVIAVVLIMQNKLKNPYFSNQGCCLSCCSHYALRSHEKILIFPSLGCCHSCCSHDAK